MLELKNVSKYYNANGITNLGLRNINLKLHRNEIVAITGDSGSGKSTLLNVLSKIDSFDEGEIYYRGNETSYFSINDMDDFRKNKVGFIFQNYNIIDSYTVLENVMVPLLLKGKSRREAKEEAKLYLEKVGLSKKLKNRGSKLSGGEKQRCVIARALASDCEILACDEPTGNLDSKTGEEIINLLKEVSKDKLVLIVTHDYALVEKIATRKIRMHDGEIIEDHIFVEKECEKECDLDLDYKPLKRKTDARIALNNVLFTPKKTIFVSLVFIVIFFIILIVFEMINYFSNDLYVMNSYNNLQSNRLYVYDEKHHPLDLDDLALYEYEINPFNEDIYYSVSDYFSFSFRAFYNDHVSIYKKVEGELPDSADEFYFIFPDDSKDIKEVQSYLNQNINIEFNYSTSHQYRLSGYATSKQVSEPTICFNETIKEMMIQYEIHEFMIDDNYYYNIDINHDGKTILYLPNSMSYETIKIFYVIPYLINDYEIIRTNDTEPRLSYDQDIRKIDEVYEASIYIDDISKTKRELEAKGYAVDIPSLLVEDNNATVFLMNLASYLFMFSSLFSMWLMFIITYLILAKIYNSRKKDYEILRTLGVTKRDMKKIVWYEVLIIGVVAIIIAYLLVFILLSSVEVFKDILPISFGTTCTYIVVALMLMMLLTKIFNRRLFKFTVSHSLKGDDYFD